MQHARLILLPGLGADARLLSPQKAEFQDALETPDWLPPEPGEPLERYARRFAQHLRAGANDDRPVFLGGVSFGGILAMHMAEALEPEAVLLIASCRSSDDVPLRFELAQKLGSAIPDAAAPKLLPLLAIGFALRDGLDWDHLGLLRQMARDADPAVLQWGGHAVADWDFHDADDLPCPVHRIHGRHDWVIPWRDDDRAEAVAGRHLINLTLDRTVNDFIRGAVEQHGAQLPPRPVRPPARADRPTYLALGG